MVIYRLLAFLLCCTVIVEARGKARSKKKATTDNYCHQSDIHCIESKETMATAAGNGGQTNPAAARYVQSKEFNDLVRQFHEKHARFPKDEVDKAKARHTQIMTKILEHLRSKNIVRGIEYTGSSYEGIKIGSSPPEFDCMVVLSGGDNLGQVPISPGYVSLKPSKDKEHIFLPYLNDKKQLVPTKVAQIFFGQLQQCINALNFQNEVKLRAHGPAIQMDVNRGGRFWYSVDVVPAYDLAQGGESSLYVAKPIKDEAVTSNLAAVAWRHSFSIAEKDRLNGIDNADNGCRKQCVRILKVLREKDTTLKKLPSFFIKTTLLHKNNQVASWKQSELGERVVTLLSSLATSLEKGELYNFYQRKLNLLVPLTSVVRQNIATRIRRILNSEVELQKIFKV